MENPVIFVIIIIYWGSSESSIGTVDISSATYCPFLLGITAMMIESMTRHDPAAIIP